MSKEPYRLSVAQLCEQLKTTVQNGLALSVIIQRQQQFGYNELPEQKGDSILTIFLSQFKSPLIYLLLCAAVLIFFFGEKRLDAFIISAILLFNATLGTFQEGKTQSILVGLKKLFSLTAFVVRDGTPQVIPERELVRGDLIILTAGDQVPADARIIEASDFSVDEAILTGESNPVRKTSEPISNERAVYEQWNMSFKGTHVVSGTARAVVTEIGINTEVGKIQKAAEQFSTVIPLRAELDRLAYFIIIFVAIFCVCLLVFSLFLGKPFKEVVALLAALFICVIPEGLPTVLTLVLVRGVRAMANASILVKKMAAVEALGRVDVIVIDKTGTVTRNEMMVSRLDTLSGSYTVTGAGYQYGGELFEQGKLVDLKKKGDLVDVARILRLLNPVRELVVRSGENYQIKGDPTAAALAVLSEKLGTDELVQEQYEKICEIPFSSETRCHRAVFQETKNGEYLVCIAGAVEALTQRSSGKFAQLKEKEQRLLNAGMRVIAVGLKRVEKAQVETLLSDTTTFCEKISHDGISICALIGLEDAVREDSKEMVESVRTSGVRIIMATGDHQVTALTVARAVSIFRPEDHGIDGAELATMSDATLAEQIERTTVFSRVLPEDKVRIIKALHAHGHIVAMTGDGVNDAPSLTAADVGIAMGTIGTEVAKNAADIVLMNDSFAYIVRAIEEGRHIFYTLKRIVLYFFATNLGELLIVLFTFIVDALTPGGFPLPLTAAQILWLNLVTDGFLDIGLSLEKKEKNLLDQKFLLKKQRLLDAPLVRTMLLMSTTMALGSLLVFLFLYKQNLAHARTMTLITMAMYQWFNAWNCRSLTESLFQIGIFSNRPLIGVTIFVLGLQCVVLYVPFFQYLFDTQALTVRDWSFVILCTAPLVLVDELRKWLCRTKK